MITVKTRLVEATKPFKVRASCGHIEVRRMREATAGARHETQGSSTLSPLPGRDLR